MSSVLRFTAQTPSRVLYNEAGASVITYADLMTWAAANNAVVSGSMISLNMNDSDFGDAMFDLFDNYNYSTSSRTTLLDLGKKIYIGMPNGTNSELAGESQIVTMTLVKVLQGSNRNLLAYVVTTTNITDTIDNNADGYLDVEVGRGAA